MMAPHGPGAFNEAVALFSLSSSNPHSDKFHGLEMSVSLNNALITFSVLLAPVETSVQISSSNVFSKRTAQPAAYKS